MFANEDYKKRVWECMWWWDLNAEYKSDIIAY